MKTCSFCHELKCLDEFYSSKSYKNKLSSRCKKCSNIYAKEYYRQHKDSIRQYKKSYRIQNIEKIRENNEQFRFKNFDAIKEYNKNYRIKNSARLKCLRRKYLQVRRQLNPEFKIMDNLRVRINKALRCKGIIKSIHTLELLGCTIHQLKEHLSKQFYPNSRTGEQMTWDNKGLKGWHIDHIKPCAAFDLTDPKQQKQCFHYTNLQPLWAFDNFSKGAAT